LAVERRSGKKKITGKKKKNGKKTSIRGGGCEGGTQKGSNLNCPRRGNTSVSGGKLCGERGLRTRRKKGKKR